MEELIKYIVSNLVDDVNAIKIDSNIDGDTQIFSVTVADSDVGKVIGRNGKIAQSIRAIVKGTSNKFSTDLVKRYILKINNGRSENVTETVNIDENNCDN